MSPDMNAILYEVFGEGTGTDPRARANVSNVEFVRSIDQLVKASPHAKGRRLTAREALDAYGLDVLREVASEGSALLAASADAAGRVLRERRDQLNLTPHQVARRADLSVDVLKALEASQRRPVREYEHVARVLGLDERMVSVRDVPVGNERIAVRLRTLQGTGRTRLSATTVGALAEAAWVAATQVRLDRFFDFDKPEAIFEYSTDYGAPGWPAWRAGFELAECVRALLTLGRAPIPSLRDLCERRLRIPVIQTELGDEIAGATVESEGCRAIVLNLSGRNREVFVRRATLAHEVGHILFDPPVRLDDLRVDAYDDLERSVEEMADSVEQRANAFSIELLAPQTEAVKLYQTTVGNPLRAIIDHFGVSFTAARYQVWNGLKRTVPFDTLVASTSAPDPRWEAAEQYTIDYHPIRALARTPSRAGRFSALVIRAAQEGYVSWDTASVWLHAPIDEVRSGESTIRSLYPDVFGMSGRPQGQP